MKTEEAIKINMSTPDGHGKVFDWDKAAGIIVDNKPYSAIAGLALDMEWTSGEIWRDSKPVFDSYTYLYSRWATPIIVLCDKDGNEYESIECWQPGRYNGWDEDTKWPKSALKIIEEAAHD